MARTPARPGGRVSRKRLKRAFLILVYLSLAAGTLWLGMSIPSYYRSVSPLVLEAAATGTPTLAQQAAEALEAGRPGPAALLEAAARKAGMEAARPEARETLLAEHPLYRWSGGPAPFYEQFLQQADHLREDETAVIPTLLPGEHRRQLRGFLAQSPNRNVQRILQSRELGGWQRFYPVYSTSGQPLEATILTVALLEQAGSLPEDLRRSLLEALEGALAGEAGRVERLEVLYLGLLTLGRQADWLQLQYLIEQLGGREPLLLAAEAVQEDPERLPLLFAGLVNAEESSRLVDYLARHGDRGWASLETALGMGRGAVRTLLEFDRPLYHPPGFWKALPESLRRSQESFKEFAENAPGMAMGLRALAFALCGFFLVAALRAAILGHLPPPDEGRRFLIQLDSLVGGTLVMLLVWVLIEPGLLEFRPNEEGSLQINLAQIIPENSVPASETLTHMIDQVTILVLLLFFVAQLLVFIFCLLKIAEVRRQNLAPQIKLNLLDNEENLFDLGLYVGLGGTVGSLILVVLNVVDASLMAAYASTLFGIIFVAILKVGFLRPFRRKLILQVS